MIRSPFPDVEIPDVSLTDFVLAGAGGWAASRLLSTQLAAGR